MKLRCLIVDDEPIARQIIAQYCSQLQLDIVGSCGDALEAREVIRSENVDVIFVDITMPILDGIAFVKTLRGNSQVIFTTAYKEFAHEAFDLNACDYLLKPFSLERFIQAIDKVRDRLSQQEKSAEAEPFTYIKTDGRIVWPPTNL